MEEVESEGSDIASDGDTEKDEDNADDKDDQDIDLYDFQLHGRWTTNHTEFIRRNVLSFNQGEAGAHVQHPKEARQYIISTCYREILFGHTLLMKPIVKPIKSSVENLYGMTRVYVGQV